MVLCRDDDGAAFVLHNANVSSSGTVTEIELADFSKRQSGSRTSSACPLIGSLVDRD